MLTALRVVVGDDVDVAILEILIEIGCPLAAAAVVGAFRIACGHEADLSEVIAILLTFDDIDRRGGRGRDQLRKHVGDLRPLRLSADPFLTVPIVLRETGLVGEAMHLQIGCAVCEPINILGGRGRERPSASVGLLLWFKLRQSKLPPYMIATRDRIVAGKAMHHETVRRSAVALDRKRTILGGVSRPRHERFAVGYITTERLGDLFN